MRYRAFLHLVASVLVSLPFVASAFADAGIQVSGPIVHDNLAIYLVHGSGGGGGVPLTLQEALAKGVVKVHETGSVNALTVENTGKDEVFVQAGDIVKGGQQDRVLSVDLLLPPRSGAGVDRGVLRRARPVDGARQRGRQAVLERRLGHAVA